MAQTESEETIVSEVVEAAGDVADTARGMAAITGKLTEERQTRVDEAVDLMENVGKQVKREERLASRQVNEVANDLGNAFSLFAEAILDPEKFRESLKDEGDSRK